MSYSVSPSLFHIIIFFWGGGGGGGGTPEKENMLWTVSLTMVWYGSLWACNLELPGGAILATSY